MAKGYHGESCAEAVRKAIGPGETITFWEFYERVQQLGSWTDATIFQHLMSCVVNLPPAREHWSWREPFLFLRGDGRYELYDPAVHPRVVTGTRALN